MDETHAPDDVDESAYAALAATLDADHGEADGRWAFGTGFTDAAVETTAPVPDGADAADVATYCLMLADDALVAGQRLAEWTTHAPELEEEVALANVALDLLGQARPLLARAGHLGAAAPFRVGPQPDEDVLALFRDERAFRNVCLVETDPGDFGRTVAWLLVLAAWRLALATRLTSSTDPVVAAVAAKAVPELTYHRDHAARWVVRLGDGTDESHRRAQAGLEAVWPFVEELFVAHPVETRLVDAGVAVDPATVRADVDAVLDQVLATATLTRPETPPVGLVGGRGGRDGVHTEALGPVLALLQSLARAHPEATW